MIIPLDLNSCHVQTTNQISSIDSQWQDMHFHNNYVYDTLSVLIYIYTHIYIIIYIDIDHYIHEFNFDIT